MRLSDRDPQPIADRGIRSDPVVGELSTAPLHPAWRALMRLCREIQHGELERLVVQDGLPVLVELTRKKVRLL